jgi:hypothetical protein
MSRIDSALQEEETVEITSSLDPYMDSAQLPAAWYVFTIHEETMYGQPIEPTQAPLTGLSRILARQSYIHQRAQAIQEQHGDPTQNLAEMLGSLPGSQEAWDVLVDAPY